MRRRLRSLVLIALLAVPAMALARVDLTSGGGFLFDISEAIDFSPGSLQDGSVDAYDTCYRLRVGGAEYSPTGSTVLSVGGRQVELPVQTLAGLSVRRVVYVPTSGGDYARYLEILENVGSGPISTTVEVLGNLGSDGSTVTTGTSSGDAIINTSDTWFATDDSIDGGDDPSLAHVLSGTSPSISPSAVTLAGDNIEYRWPITVAAGDRVVFMHFAVQSMTRALSMAEAQRIVEVPDDVLMGAEEYLDDIVNFSIAVAGAPRVRFSSALEVDEGSDVRIDVAISDPEGDRFTFSWDLDDDGTFGERTGETVTTIPAGTTDGPGAIRVGIEAIDSSGNTDRRYRTLQVVNVDPRIISAPPTVTSVGVDLGYAIEVDDPAGALDPLTYSLITGPMRMTISVAGVVRWTPNESDVTMRGESHIVEVQVHDGDEGVATQRWELSVSPNRRPTTPIPAYPTDRIAILDPMPRLVTQNSEDIDLDPLHYTFELDSVETFDSPDFIELDTDEMPGFTSIDLLAPLRVDRLYYWRVKAFDGTIDSEWGRASFWVVHDPLLPWDAGPPDAGPGGDAGTYLADAGTGGAGGGCSASGGRTSAVVPFLLALLALGRRRRSVRGGPPCLRACRTRRCRPAVRNSPGG